ncbi:tetratricopeptide repeat protein [Mesorhizobium australicum]|uniref:tetratricopeptide repeat protein n=1 Tax=Mesorhizobium australicum TaxID=536018 RepID=UPI00111C4970|nr:hypothetical protein [Mesorhizobium australicum]
MALTPTTEMRGSEQARSEIHSSARRELERSLREWHAQPDLISAAEVADAVSLAGQDVRANSALEFFRSSSTQKIAYAALPSSYGDDTLYSTIRKLKVRLRRQPLDAIAAIELARNYTLIGQLTPAAKAAERALKAAPEDRFVLRSAARFFVHQGDLARAYRAITKSNLVRVDPWIMSTEVALADLLGRSPRWGISQIAGIAGSKRINRQYSELASALGMLEISSGNRKRARRLIARSLDNPTENAVAQAQWMDRSDKLQVDYPNNLLEREDMHEARVLHSLDTGEVSVGVESVERWFLDEPYSVRAAAHGSFISLALARDYEAGLGFADRGLVANPSSFMLQNNRAFALAKLGRVEEAEIALSKIKPPSKSVEAMYRDGLEGLVRFKKGDLELGRHFYMESIFKAKDAENYPVLLSALMHWFEQEFEAGTIDRETAVDLVKNIDMSLARNKRDFDMSLRRSWDMIKASTICKEQNQNRKVLGSYKGVEFFVPADLF